MGKSQSKTPEPGASKDANCVRFALVGFSGSGKSAFVNAVRGIPDDDKQAAGVGIVETREGPIEYTYPSHPLVSFCDLPGYGTPNYPDVESYWKGLHLEKFDVFLIFISFRLTELDRLIIQKIKSKDKSLFLIHAKIDDDVNGMMRKNEHRLKPEEKLMNEIKECLKKQMCRLSCPYGDIFLINNYDPYQGDFFRLIEAIMNMFPPAPQADTSNDLTEHYLLDARAYIKENGVLGIEEFLRKKLEGSKAVKIRFGITGGSGTGKSAFINAIRGLEDSDKDAANVGVTETTTEPVEYEHPDNPKITFVDLPGIDSPRFTNLETYYENVGFENYDAFLILTATRFTQNVLELARKIRDMGKSFFLVRTKIDNDYISNERKNANKEFKNIKKEISKNALDYLEGLISSEDDIFLIDNYNKDEWDFDRLIEAINNILPIVQRECLTLYLSNLTRECLKRKAEIFKAQAVAVAALSAATGAIPIPGVGGAVDLLLIGGTVAFYFRQLGLTNTTVKEITLLDEKWKEILSRYQFGSTKEFALKIATKTLGFKFGIDEVSKFIPIIGMAIAGSISFAMTLRYLIKSINELEGAALVVWDNAKNRSIQNE